MDDHPAMTSAGKTHRVLRLRTIAVYLLFFVVGMAVAVPGPTLVNMRSLFGTDTAMMSLSFSLHGIGYLAGAALCGLLFERVNREVQFCGAILVTAVPFIIVPWSQSVYALLVLMTLFGLGVGYTATGGNAQVISMWKGHRSKDPLLQGLQCSWSVGNTIAPFVISPFLTPLRADEPLCSLLLANVTQGAEVFESFPCINQTDDGPEGAIGMNRTQGGLFGDLEYMAKVARVRYAYLLIGLPVLFLLPGFICLHSYYKEQKQKSNNNSATAVTIVIPKRHESRLFRRGLLFQLYIFAFTCAIIINIADGYYSLFVVENLNWTVRQGALITSMFMGAKAVGRFLGIPFSYFFSSRSLLYINVSMCFAGHFLMLFTESIGDMGMFIAVCVAGFGLSNINANLILWVSSNLHVTSRVSAAFFTGLSSGFIIGYTLVGVLMQYLGNIWLIYALMTSSVVQVVLFATMQLYIYFFKPPDEPDLVLETEVKEVTDVNDVKEKDNML